MNAYYANGRRVSSGLDVHVYAHDIAEAAGENLVRIRHIESVGGLDEWPDRLADAIDAHELEAS